MSSDGASRAWAASDHAHRVLLVAGEASGDLHGADLVRALRVRVPDLEVFGLGGERLREVGMETVADARDVATVGVTEAAGRLRALWRAYRALGRRLRDDPPDLCVLIDFPEFNLRLARAARRAGVPVVYFIPPQVWAWRGWRVRAMRRVVSLVLAVFPFEAPLYRRAGVPVEFVGHPLVDLAKPRTTRERFLVEQRLSSGAPTVAVLPGSRPNEVSRIFPDLMASAERIRVAIPDAQFVVARAPHLEDRLFEEALRASRTWMRLVEGDTDTVLASSDLALTASGTATVQAALHDTPMIVVYRVSAATYLLARWLVSVRAIAMVNLIAGETVVPELVQDAFTPDAVAREAIAMLSDRERSARVRQGLARVRARLGGSGASRRAAEAILRVVHQPKSHARHHDHASISS
jgi:lipid-A-disaccharide synthase